MNDIDVPDIEICGTSQDLRILRCDFTSNNDSKQIDGCSDYLFPSVIDYSVYNKHCLNFKANKTIKFINPDSSISGLQRIGFYFYVNTTATAEVQTFGIASLAIQLVPSNFNPLSHPDQATSQMDKTSLSELKLQLKFIAVLANYAAIVNFKTSTYRTILPNDDRANFGLGPKYHMTPKIESFVNYIPFSNNPYNIPVRTTGYFSIAAGSFIQEQITEERSSTILSTIAAAGGAFGTMAGVMVFFFGDFPLNPWGFVYKFYNFIQKSKDIIKRSRFYPKLDFKFSKINDEDKALLVNEFSNIRYSIYYHLINKMDKNSGPKFKFYHWLLNTENIGRIFRVYEIDREYYKFSSINEEDERLLNNEIYKIRYIIDVCLYDKPKDPKKFAEYKYERELKFSDDTKNEDKELQIIDEEDRKSLKDEFRKIRKLIDKHLLGKPNIEKIFNAYKSLQNNNFSEDMGEDKKFLTD
ncbi:hypothetical protein RhiirA4_485272, partial [Rhizophagus irregularis]